MEKRDIYNCDRVKTGTVKGKSTPLLDHEHILIVHLCLFNKQNEMLIQKRQPFKNGWSGLWDLTVGGSSVAGENSSQAIAREVFEEIGLERDFSSLRPYLTLQFKQGFDDYYFLKEDVDLSTLTLQESEVEKVMWANEEKVLSMITSGEFIPYYPSFVQTLFAMARANTFPFPSGAISGLLLPE